MCKRLLVGAVVLAAAVWLAPAPARADSQRLLVLFQDTEDPKEQAAQHQLRQLMLYTGQDCVFARAGDKLPLEDCTSVILCTGQEDCLDPDEADALKRREIPVFVVGGGSLSQLADTTLLEGSVVVRCQNGANEEEDILTNATSLTCLGEEAREQGEDMGVGWVFVGPRQVPLCIQAGSVAQMPYFDPDSPAMCAALATAVQRWLWPYRNQPTEYGQYLVLDQVYPFQEPAQLMEVTDALLEEGVPFAVSVMPIYQNGDFPAMKRFCQWLSYLQSQNVGIILRCPMVTLDYVDLDDLRKHTAIAYQAYASYGVYPVAIQAPANYLLSKKGVAYLSSFRTVVTFESDETPQDIVLDSNPSYKDGHRIIAPAWRQRQAYTGAYPQAIYLDPTQSPEILREQVKRIKNSRRTLKNLNAMENNLYVGRDHVWRSGNALEVNGEPVSLEYHPFVYEEYEFDRGFDEYLKAEIQASNRFIVIFVLVACSFFLAAIALSRRVIRRQLILGPRKARRKQGKKDPPQEGGTHESG